MVSDKRTRLVVCRIAYPQGVVFAGKRSAQSFQHVRKPRPNDVGFLLRAGELLRRAAFQIDFANQKPLLVWQAIDAADRFAGQFARRQLLERLPSRVIRLSKQSRMVPFFRPRREFALLGS
jgi:hypothetical protein